MNHLINKFAGIGLNRRSFTEDDFYRICEQEKIRVIEIGEPFSWWMQLDGESVIVLSKNLRGYKLLFTMMHELAHHYLTGGQSLNQIRASGGSKSKEEFEADLFAILAIYPLPVLVSGELLEFEKHDKFLRIIRKERERFYFLYENKY